MINLCLCCVSMLVFLVIMVLEVSQEEDIQVLDCYSSI